MGHGHLQMAIIQPTIAEIQTQASLTPNHVLFSLFFAASTKSVKSLILGFPWVYEESEAYFSADWTSHRNTTCSTKEKYPPFPIGAGRAIHKVGHQKVFPTTPAVSQMRLQEVASMAFQHYSFVSLFVISSTRMSTPGEWGHIHHTHHSVPRAQKSPVQSWHSIDKCKPQSCPDPMDRISLGYKI